MYSISGSLLHVQYILRLYLSEDNLGPPVECDVIKLLLEGLKSGCLSSLMMGKI